jgi:ArsR family transcriptional regulator, arsenate/arsenite/antimonite-responsive transcriptional repressor
VEFQFSDYAIYQALQARQRRRVSENGTVGRLDILSYFCKYRNMASAMKKNAENVARFADMFSAMGTEVRLRIMQLLLSAHPEGMVVGELQEELDIPNSTLSHHLDKLRNEGLVQVRRESTFLRYTANTEALQEVLRFLYAECCTRNKAVEPRDVIQICK